MIEHPDTAALLFATIAADVIVGVGSAVMLVAGALLIRSRRDAMLARLPADTPEEPTGAVALAFYGLSLLFWPAGVALGLWFMSKPQSARAGAVCLWMVLAYLAFSVVVAIAIVTAAALLAPQWFAFL